MSASLLCFALFSVALSSPCELTGDGSQEDGVHNPIIEHPHLEEGLHHPIIHPESIDLEPVICGDGTKAPECVHCGGWHQQEGSNTDLCYGSDCEWRNGHCVDIWRVRCGDGTVVEKCSDCPTDRCDGSDCIKHDEDGQDYCLKAVNCGDTTSTRCLNCPDGEKGCKGECIWWKDSCTHTTLWEDPDVFSEERRLLKTDCGNNHVRAGSCKDCPGRMKAYEELWTEELIGPGLCGGDCTWDPLYHVVHGPAMNDDPEYEYAERACTDRAEGSQDYKYWNKKAQNDLFAQGRCELDSWWEQSPQANQNAFDGTALYWEEEGKNFWTPPLDPSKLDQASKLIWEFMKDQKLLGTHKMLGVTKTFWAGKFLKVVRKLIPRSSPTYPPCAEFSDDEWFECVWAGIAPYVGRYIDYKIDQLTYANYWAMLKSTVLQIERLLAQAEIDGWCSDDDSECQEYVWEELASVDRDMERGSAYFVKEGAPYEASVYLASWGSIHLFLKSLLFGNHLAYQSPGHLQGFKNMTEAYRQGLARSVKTGLSTRGGHVEYTSVEDCCGGYYQTSGGDGDDCIIHAGYPHGKTCREVCPPDTPCVGDKTFADWFGRDPTTGDGVVGTFIVHACSLRLSESDTGCEYRPSNEARTLSNFWPKSSSKSRFDYRGDAKKANETEQLAGKCVDLYLALQMNSSKRMFFDNAMQVLPEWGKIAQQLANVEKALALKDGR